MRLLLSLFITAGLAVFGLALPAAANVTVDEVYSGSGPAEQNVQLDGEAEESAVSLSAIDYFKMIFGLLFVLVLLYGVLKFINLKNKSFQKNQLIQNLGGVQLGNQKSVQLLKIGETLYLVGIGDDVSLMDKVTDEEEKRHLLELYSERESRAASSSFPKLMKKAQGNSETDVPEGGFQSIFKSRLEEMKQKRSKQLDAWHEKERDGNE